MTFNNPNTFCHLEKAELFTCIFNFEVSEAAHQSMEKEWWGEREGELNNRRNQVPSQGASKNLNETIIKIKSWNGYNEYMYLVSSSVAG